MWGVYSFSIDGLGGYVSGYFNDVLFGETIPTFVNNFLEGIGVSPLLQALIVDGAIGGVGAKPIVVAISTKIVLLDVPIIVCKDRIVFRRLVGVV